MTRRGTTVRRTFTMVSTTSGDHQRHLSASSVLVHDTVFCLRFPAICGPLCSEAHCQVVNGAVLVCFRDASIGA